MTTASTVADEQFYNFPPFFTLQPVEITRVKQLELWRRLILNYFASNPSENLLVLDAFELFQNKKIDRILSAEGKLAVAQNLIDSGHAQWCTENVSAYIFVKTPEEWANTIYSFVQTNGLTGTIYTFYEIHSGDLTSGSAIHGIGIEVCLRALEVLQNNGKAELYISEESLDESGVKFL